MDVRVLGPVELWSATGPIDLARRQQRLILGILAVEANRIVTSDRLIDLIWEDNPPGQARAVVQTRVSELRATLTRHLSEPVTIISRDNGYLLAIDPQHVDLHRFREHVRRARVASTDDEVCEELHSGLGLWRGPALGGWLPSNSHTELCGGIEAARLTAVEDLMGTELKLGHHRAVVDEVTEIATANPARERLTQLAMTALHRTGRTAEALHLFDRCRRWLAEELGVDPGTELQQLHMVLLGADVDPATGHASSGASEVASPSSDAVQATGFTIAVPHQLPAAAPDFTGRAAEATHLAAILTEPGADVRLAVVTGPGGVGKTALSLHVAHQLTDHFQDGQLYVDLHSMDQSESPEPTDVLARFLRALGVVTVPPSVDERAELYRDLLAGRRLLILLDNARDAQQVRPLIPGASTCAVLISSRSRIATAVGGTSVDLNVLDDVEALGLLSRIVGADRVAQAAPVVASLLRMCGGRPLAIRIVAARLNAKPHWSIAQHHDRLSDERRRLDHLTYEDLDVRASIALSYAALPTDAQHLLCRLGDIGMPEVNVWSSAALLDSVPADAEETLERLHDAQLLDVAGHEAGGYCRYRLHDLVRLFARERASVDQLPADLTAARERIFGAWLHLLETAYACVYGSSVSENVPSPAPRHIVDHELARAITADPVTWVGLERQTIVRLIHRAAQAQFVAACWGMACTAFSLFEMGRHHDDCRQTLNVAMVATHGRDDVGHAALLYRLGTLKSNQNDDKDAIEHHEQAAAIFERAGERKGHTLAVLANSIMYRRLGMESAVDRLHEALAGVSRFDDGATAYAWRNLAQAEVERDNLDVAQTYFDRALGLARRSRSRRREAQVLFYNGMLQLRLDQPRMAERTFLEVSTLVRELGDRPGQIQTLRGLALCHEARGDLALAEATLVSALRLASQPTPTLMETTVREELDRLIHRRRTAT